MFSRCTQATATANANRLHVFMLPDTFNTFVAMYEPAFTRDQFRAVFDARAPQVDLFAMPRGGQTVFRITIDREVYNYELKYTSPTCRIVCVQGANGRFNESPSYVLAYTEANAVAGLNEYLGAYRAFGDRISS